MFGILKEVDKAAARCQTKAVISLAVGDVRTEVKTPLRRKPTELVYQNYSRLDWTLTSPSIHG